LLKISNVIPVHFTSEFLDNPLGIDTLKPRLSWKLESNRRHTRQTAYRIVVRDFDKGTILWDTQKVDSDQTHLIEYAGSELSSRQRCEWQVKIWDDRGLESDWSLSSYWEMGLLLESDWKARWIEPEQDQVVEENNSLYNEKYELVAVHETRSVEERLHPSRYLRKSFRVNKSVRKARIYATAHGVYMLELNGVRVGNQELAPEFTAYDRYLQYQTYDITSYLTVGDNALGAILADGWYAGRMGLTGDSCQYGNKLGLLLQMEIEYADGSTELIVTDDSFISSKGALRYSDLFIGEKLDARDEQKGWSKVGFNDEDWTNVHIADYGYGNLVAQYGEPVRQVSEIPAMSIITTPKGETVIDFGQVIAGRVRMFVEGERGMEIVLQHSEVLDEQGDFLHNIKGKNKDQTDVYVLRGGGREMFEPLFTFHGFRYVKVSGYPGTPELTDFTSVVLFSDLPETGAFETSDARINRLQQNIKWSQRGNMLSIPTDCPQRERAGWAGDIQIYAPTACFNMDTSAFLTRWLRNLRAEQLADGQVPNIIPYNRGFAEMSADAIGVSSAGWGDAVVIVPWVLYQSYGDVRVLEENYEAMEKWVRYIQKSAEEGIPDKLKGEVDARRLQRQKYLWNTGFHFGDWLIPSLTDGTGLANMMQGALATKELAATCYYAYSTELLSQIAAIIGRTNESAEYTALNQSIRAAFAEEYLDEDGRLSTHYQGMYVLALKMRMIPDAMKPKVVNQLVELITSNGNRLDTGFVSVPFLLDVLCDNGREDVAYKLLFQTQSPSWLYQVERGATTIWETWEAIKPSGQVTQVSYNHYAFGCVGDWMYRHIAGLGKLEAGYKQISIRPHLDCGLQRASARYDSVYGSVLSEWEKDEASQAVVVRVEIPANTVGTVTLPGAVLHTITESGTELANAEGVLSVREGDHDAIIEIGSGRYAFRYSYSLNLSGGEEK